MIQRKMKDSGVEWIREIPEEWEIVRVKDAFYRKNSKANVKDPIVLSLARDGIKIRDISTNEGQLASDYTNYNPVDIDDLLLNTMDLISGDNCNISKVRGVISPAYTNLRHKGGIDPRFYNYYFKILYWLKVLFSFGKGVSFDNRWTLNNETLSRLQIPLPPHHEQRKISNFLDEKTSKIDSLKNKVNNQIQVIEDYKKSIIREAVTKGLDKNVEMKDSGIEWIGEIPKHWVVFKIKRYCNLKTGSTPNTNRLEWFNGDLFWYTPSDFNENYILMDSERTLSIKAKQDNIATIIPPYTTLVVGIGATAGKVGYTMIESSCNQQITAIISNKINSKFIMYWMISNSEHLKNTASYTTLPILNNRTIGEFPIITPLEIIEQQKIVDFLDDKCRKIDKLISNKKQQLQILEDYKKSIIYECVTGKKEVPNA